MARSREDWRRRLAGEVAFDEAAAEAAIGAVYRASALPEPGHVLWVNGPRKAAQAVEFLRNPPRRQRLVGWAMLVFGAVAWAVFGLAILDPRAPEEPTSGLMLMAAVAAFFLARASARPLPSVPQRGGKWGDLPVVTGMVAFFSMAALLLLFQRLEVSPESPAGAGALLLAGAVGVLPGLFLLRRLRRAYRDVSPPLRVAAPGASVARRLRRAQSAARPAVESGLPRRPDGPLPLAYASAYEEAFRAEATLQHFGAGPLPRPGLETVWAVPGSVRTIDPLLFHPIPAHLDGIADAEMAAEAEREVTAEALAFADLAYRVDRLFPYRRVAVAVRPPSSIRVDGEGRPHAEEGPALSWADGSEVHAWHGRVVEPDLLDRRLPLTLSRIAREVDRDRRWVLIERYGLGRFLTDSEAPEVHSDHCGRLYRFEQRGEPLLAVRVVNHSPEPDGRFAEFWLRVPPGMRTAREAVAWTFGLSPEEYDPVAQS